MAKKEPDTRFEDIDFSAFGGEGLAPLPDASGHPTGLGPLEGAKHGDLAGLGVGDKTAHAPAGTTTLAPEPGAKEAAKEEKPAEEAPEEKKSPGFFEKLAASNPYSVILGLSFVFLLIGTLLLVLEWGRYGYTIKPKLPQLPTISAEPLSAEKPAEKAADEVKPADANPQSPIPNP